MRQLQHKLSPPIHLTFSYFLPYWHLLASPVNATICAANAVKALSYEAKFCFEAQSYPQYSVSTIESTMDHFPAKKQQRL